MKYNKSLNALTLRGRLILGFSAIIAILFLAVGITLYKVDSIRDDVTHVVEIKQPLYDETNALAMAVYKLQVSFHNLVVTNDQQKYDAESGKILSAIDILQSHLNGLFTAADNSQLITEWQKVSPLLDQLQEVQIKIVNANDMAVAAKITQTEINPIIDNIMTIVAGPLDTSGERAGGILTIEHKHLLENNKEIYQHVTIVEITGYIILALALLICTLIVFFTTRGIVRQIDAIRAQSSRVAAGDLTQRIEVTTSDEIGQLCQDINTMTESLAKMTKFIIEASHHMVTSLTEVRQSASVQSSGASEQAASVNQITASLEEIEKSSAQTKEKAKALGETAERTHLSGQQGLEAVEQSIHGMKVVKEKVQMIAQTILELSAQTQQVGEITAVVNNLSQQSKMLALNASIEAAKAGEAGKGFAVVALEVKNLAERSEQATTQVQKILEDIRHSTEKAVMVTEEGTKGVDVGTNLVEQTGGVVRNLTEVIEETAVATTQIEAAIRQESVGIEQITIGMNEINQVTSSFVESTRQTLEAIESLAVIAKDINEYIETFKV